MRHIILFGGSFDPVHYGHLHMAKQALEQRNADAVYFIPNQQSPFKKKNTSFSDRFKMLELATRHEDRFVVSDIEGAFEGPSYAIDTVKTLIKRYPNTSFDFLIGDDQIERLAEWRDFEKLNELLTFIVYGRNDASHEYPVINGPKIQTSSTAIRTGVSCQTPKAVLRYMTENNLYIDEILRHTLSKPRYEHVLRVCDLGIELAKTHHLDVKRVETACMWHDLYRECKETRHLVPQSYQDKPQAFDHAYLAADTLSRHYYYSDKHVLKAIRHHVNGQATNDIAKVLFIADKCERGRKYDSEPLIALSKHNLNEGFMAVKASSEAYLRRNSNE